MFSFARGVTAVLILLLVVGAGANAGVLYSHDEGALLSGVGDYDWWYGCSPTSAGMLLSTYDRDGSYPNIVPGVTADLSTFTVGPNYTETVAMIASPGNIADYYGGGYGASGDDVSAPWHTNDSLADFMGTSQDAYGNSNGSTTFWYYTDGSPLTYTDIFTYGTGYYDDSGMYGIFEYLSYAGYGSNVLSLYNQYIDAAGLTYGFTYAQYMAEIDAGRPVIIHVDGHSMLGLGYDVSAATVLLYDTWSPGPHSMTWGSSYSGLAQYGVTVLQLTGSEPIPEPAALMSLCAGLALLGGYRLRRKA